MTTDWEQEVDEILLDFCVDPDCKSPTEHSLLRAIVKERFLQVLHDATEKARAEEKKALLETLERELPERQREEKPRTFHAVGFNECRNAVLEIINRMKGNAPSEPHSTEYTGPTGIGGH